MMGKAFGNRECSELYLGVNAEYVALHLVHGVQAVGHGAQVEPLENHLVLGQSPWEKQQHRVGIAPPAHLLSWLCLQHRETSTWASS